MVVRETLQPLALKRSQATNYRVDAAFCGRIVIDVVITCNRLRLDVGTAAGSRSLVMLESDDWRVFAGVGTDRSANFGVHARVLLRVSHAHEALVVDRAQGPADFILNQRSFAPPGLPALSRISQLCMSHSPRT